MFYWILFILSLALLGFVFWRRMVLTRKGMEFERQLQKDRALEEAESESPFLSEEAPAGLSEKRKQEQRERDEKNQRLRETKKAYKQGDLLLSKGELLEAEKMLLQALSFDNEHLDSNFKLGLLYLQQENLPRAEFFFQKLIELKEHPEYLNHLAMVMHQQERLEEAARLYERSLTINPKNAPVYVRLAYVYHESGDQEHALLSFEEAARLDSKNLDYLWTLVSFYQRLERIEALRETLERVLMLDPYNEKAQALLMDLDSPL